VVTDDEVIDKLDIEHFARFNELPGDSNVLGRRCGIAAGVVVTNERRNTAFVADGATSGCVLRAWSDQGVRADGDRGVAIYQARDSETGVCGVVA
jgi:hypothetical protein